MAAPRNRKHILVSKAPRVDSYTPHGGRRTTKVPGAPPIGRPAHAASLKASLEQAARDAVARRASAGIAVHGATPGVYVELEAVPGWLDRASGTRLEPERSRMPSGRTAPKRGCAALRRGHPKREMRGERLRPGR